MCDVPAIFCCRMINEPRVSRRKRIGVGFCKFIYILVKWWENKLQCITEASAYYSVCQSDVQVLVLWFHSITVSRPKDFELQKQMENPQHMDPHRAWQKSRYGAASVPPVSTAAAMKPD